jgi:hypothetical protein
MGGKWYIWDPASSSCVYPLGTGATFNSFLASCNAFDAHYRILHDCDLAVGLDDQVFRAESRRLWLDVPNSSLVTTSAKTHRTPNITPKRHPGISVPCHPIHLPMVPTHGHFLPALPLPFSAVFFPLLFSAFSLSTKSVMIVCNASFLLEISNTSSVVTVVRPACREKDSRS